MTFAMGPALLFCPADRSDRYAKAAQRSPAVILDLEDAVAPADKAAARASLIAHPLDAVTTIVRVNAMGTPDFAADLAAVEKTDYRTIMLAKASSAGQLDSLRGYDVVALCETAAGVLAAPDLDAAKAWWARVLGIEPYFDEPFFVGFSPGGYELGLDPNADPAAGAVSYWGVPDAGVAYAELLAAGATPRDPVTEVGDGIRLGTVTDAVGSIVGVIENPVFELVPVEAGGPGK